MTAPLLNASTLQPTAATGAATGLFGPGAAAQGPMAGFEALLTAFFGGQGAAEPLLGPDGKPILKTPGAAKDAKASMADREEAETADTATPSTDAQILAALLAQPIAAPAAPVATTAGDTAEGETPAGAPAATAFAPLVPDATLAQAEKAAKGGDAKTVTAAGAMVQAATDAASEASDADAAGEPAALADADAPSPFLESKPAAERPSAAAAAASPATETAAARPVAPPPAHAAVAAAAAASQAPAAPAPVATAAEISDVAEAVVAAEAVETSEADAAPEAPAAPPRAKTAARAARSEAGPRTEATATPTPADSDVPGAVVTAQAGTAETFNSGAESKREDAAPAVEAKADTDTGQPVAPNVGDAAATASTSAPAEARPGPQTVAHLAAQIVKKLEGRSTQFDVALNPEGLGRVDVRIEIGAQGKLTASMAFENPLAASELRARAGELQKALEQAGFDISGGIRFDVAADRGQGQAGQGQFGQDFQNNGGASRGRAFQAALDSADQTADAALSGALNLQRRTLMSGVDVRI